MATISSEDFYRNDLNEAFIKKVQEDFIKSLHQELQFQYRPPSEIILDDVDIQSILKISKRQTANLREQRLIDYSQPIPKGKIYHTLRDALEFVERGRVYSIFRNPKTK